MYLKDFYPEKNSNYIFAEFKIVYGPHAALIILSFIQVHHFPLHWVLTSGWIPTLNTSH